MQLQGVVTRSQTRSTRLDSTCAHVRLSGAFPAMSYVSDKTETMHIFSP